MAKIQGTFNGRYRWNPRYEINLQVNSFPLQRNVLNEVIFYREILPGYGKWSRNPTLEDVVNLA